jgi:hypothetical protein
MFILDDHFIQQSMPFAPFFRAVCLTSIIVTDVEYLLIYHQGDFCRVPVHRKEYVFNTTDLT